jgi:hypothetical protein
MTTLLILFITKRQFERRKKETNDREKISLKIAIAKSVLDNFSRNFFCALPHLPCNFRIKAFIVYNFYAHSCKILPRVAQESEKKKICEICLQFVFCLRTTTCHRSQANVCLTKQIVTCRLCGCATVCEKNSVFLHVSEWIKNSCVWGHTCEYLIAHMFTTSHRWFWSHRRFGRTYGPHSDARGFCLAGLDQNPVFKISATAHTKRL